MTEPSTDKRSRARDLRIVTEVARREFLTQTARPEFWGSLIIMALIVVVSMGAQKLFSDEGSTPTVAVADSATGYRTELTDQGIAVRSEPSDDSVRAAVEADEVSAGVLTSGAVVFLDRVDAGVVDAVQSAHESVLARSVLTDSGLTPDRISAALDVPSLDVVTLDPDAERSLQATIVAIIGVVAIFFLMFSFGQSIAHGVLEEKSSRVAEVLLAKIKAWHLLTGKIVGLGAVVLIQILVLMIGGVTAAATFGLMAVPADGIRVGLLVLAWFVPGYVLVATLWAVAGALVSRPEDIANAAGPVSMVMTLGVFGALFPFTGLAPAIGDVLSMVPGFSWSMMPVRMAAGPVPGWQSLVAVALSVLAVTALIRLGSRIYVGGLLDNSGVLKARQALRTARESGLS
ncbi:ABC transporter permease [Rhodococcoides corynebacterioides]|uniref:ABC transporter permease n=1 Tax=Rhodococcoides corynebacterioides TaxID=53972 RepID=UPI001C9ADC81|nr:ABC transporter permease [Rhodococcus corynebacterioides]MBY6350956.1 ABC transporter permease [Rhodococcus corynebacterioides]